MPDPGFWFEGFPGAITVTDAEGTILAMNRRSRETFASDGGGELIGRNIHDCHPEPAASKVRALYDTREPNSYTIEKNEARKIIHQIPWYREGAFGGFVEISIPIPNTLPHFLRESS